MASLVIISLVPVLISTNKSTELPEHSYVVKVLTTYGSLYRSDLCQRTENHPSGC